MSLTSVNSTSPGTYTSAASANAAAKQEDQFLQLLITQIRNQNPLDPMDNAEFTSQLTELSSLDQLELINTNLEQNLVYSQSLNNTMMLGLVGRTATVEGDKLQVADGEVSTNSIQAAGPGTASIRVLDEDGNLVTTYTREIEYGLNDVSWNGEKSDGEMAADGLYTLEMDIQGRDGATLEFATFMQGDVESIRFENNLAVMSVHGRDYYASEILEIGI